MTVVPGTVALDNLWRAFFDGLIDNDEKVASKKHTESKNGSLFKNIIFETRDQKPYPIYA